MCRAGEKDGLEMSEERVKPQCPMCHAYPTENDGCTVVRVDPQGLPIGVPEPCGFLVWDMTLLHNKVKSRPGLRRYPKTKKGGRNHE